MNAAPLGVGNDSMPDPSFKTGQRTCETAPEKPAEGAPCNGCGLCCAAEPCGLAVEFIGTTTGPCPAMEFNNGRFWCGLVRNPSEYLDTPAFGDHMLGAIFAQALGVGRGCDSTMSE